MLRYVRIAFSAVCGILCLLLVALWVRSYHKKDDCRRVIGTTVLDIQSLRGELGIGLWAWRYKPFPWRMSNENVDESMEDLWPPMKSRSPLSIIGLRWQSFSPDMTLVAVRFWLLILLSGTFVAAPWMHWRFRLRTLLIGMTLVAVVLGLIVAAI